MAKHGLAEFLVSMGVLKSPRLINAFEEIDRNEFVPKRLEPLAYSDQALPIGHEQTISQPYTVAFMLELLDPGQGHKILDVGSGSGWTTALLAQVAGRSGRVIGLERIPELVEMGQVNLRRVNVDSAEIRQAKKDVIGLPQQAPYDRILVSAAAETVPDELVDQLSVPGKMVIPVRDCIVLVEKDSSGGLSTETFRGFVFVPLIS